MKINSSILSLKKPLFKYRSAQHFKSCFAKSFFAEINQYQHMQMLTESQTQALAEGQAELSLA